MQDRGDRLINRLLQGGNGTTANELLKEFFSGYPVENLRPLLASEEESVVKAAAWLFSELGREAAPIFDAVVPLLAHESKYVRFFSIDVVLVCGADREGKAIARAIALLLDAEDAVRWKSLVFIAKASRDQLAASLVHQQSQELQRLTSWLLDVENSESHMEHVRTALANEHALHRLFASAAAVRLYLVSPVLLKVAAESPDREVASFASEQLKLLR